MNDNVCDRDNEAQYRIGVRPLGTSLDVPVLDQGIPYPLNQMIAGVH
jgi:hypothetical protein